MQKLSDQHRLVVTLHDVQGLAHEEIAEVMEAMSGRCGRGCFTRVSSLQGLLGGLFEVRERSGPVTNLYMDTEDQNQDFEKLHDCSS